ncbi:MAG: hypothetical protein EOO07_30645 [Chitinophagaceae bacterium]|nr:MAG: hypothetical protein EOO07_30645 [Chitinophagaceae bacterium]
MDRLPLIILCFIVISCNVKKKDVPVNQRNALEINCENEKSLIKNPLANKEYSFDSITTVKNYWKLVHHDNEISNNKLYPYTTVFLDIASLFQKVQISLIGARDWRADGRLKLSFENNSVDTLILMDFFRVLSKRNPVQNAIQAQLQSNKINAEILLYFYNDSIYEISTPLKKIVGAYISFQRFNSEEKFHSKLCYLDSIRVDSLKRNVPLRIRLVTSLTGR